MGGVTSDSQNIWIDHDSFRACGDKCIAVGVGTSGLDPSTGKYYSGTLVSISNSIFKDSWFAVAIDTATGGPMGAIPINEQPNSMVTLYGNLFSEVNRRSPRVSGAGSWAHVFNNVIQYWGGFDSSTGDGYGFGPSSNDSAQLLLEDNYLRAWPSPNACQEADDLINQRCKVTDPIQSKGVPAGYIRATNNFLANSATDQENGPSVVFTPPYSYSPLDPLTTLNSVIANAGVITN